MNPRITGNHPRNSYSLDTRLGTITQVETCAFATSFLGTGNYPTFRRLTDRMLKGRVQMGTDAKTQARWHHDSLKDCSQDDQIFGWSVRSSEVLHHDKEKIDDEVLREMLYQGILDPKDGAPAWTEKLNLRQGLRLMSSAIVRVLQCIFAVEKRIGENHTLYKRMFDNQALRQGDVKNKIAVLESTYEAMDQGFRNAVYRIDKDLMELNNRIDHRRAECDEVERRLAELVVRHAEQSDAVDVLKVQVESMVGQLCECNKENEEFQSVLDKPIVLHRQGDGPAPIGPLPPLSGLPSASSSLSGLNTLVKNGEPIPVIYPSLELIQTPSQGSLPIGLALSIMEQRLRAELEMSEAERGAHIFISWLLEEDDYGWMGDDENDVLDWDGNNDN